MVRGLLCEAGFSRARAEMSGKGNGRRMMNDEERLQQLYDEKPDDVLVEMWANREDLTEMAQAALESVMRSRRLETAREAQPEVAVPERVAGADEEYVSLFTFGDMFQARQAVELLEEAKIQYKPVNQSQNAGITEWGTQSAQIEVLVTDQDYAAAVKVLHDGLGLFPQAEMDAPDADAGPLDDLVSVLMIDAETELQEGIAAARALAEKGVSFMWHDGRDFPEGLADAATVSIEVRSSAYKKAAGIVHDLG
jgi:hypothetical protein